MKASNAIEYLRASSSIYSTYETVYRNDTEIEKQSDVCEEGHDQVSHLLLLNRANCLVIVTIVFARESLVAGAARIYDLEVHFHHMP